MSDITCNGETYGDALPIVGSMTYHTLATIISAACTISACIIYAGLAVTHLFKFRIPDEQRQIVRIIVTPAIMAIFSLFSVWFYHIAGYLKPIGEYYECFALVAIFFLFIHCATPNNIEGIHPFQKLEILAVTYPEVTLRKLYTVWIMVFQIIVVKLIILIITLAKTGSECELLGKKTKVQTILNAISAISIVFCLMGLIRVYKILKPSIAGHKPLLKLVLLKIIVGLDVIQSFIFSALSNSNDIKPTPHLSLPDLLIGTPDLLLCCECFVISILFILAFSAGRYNAQNNSGQKKGLFGALFDVLNISDIVSGIFYTAEALSGRQDDNLQSHNSHGYGYDEFGRELPK